MLEVAVDHSMRVGGAYTPMPRCYRPIQEFFHQVGRSAVISRHLKSQPFVFLLIVQAIQRTLLDKICGLNADQQCAVRIALVPSLLAHPIGDNGLRIVSGGQHRAARAHAESIDASFTEMNHPFVGGGGEEFRKLSILHVVNALLQMFHADTPANGFGSMGTPQRASASNVSRAE